MVGSTDIFGLFITVLLTRLDNWRSKKPRIFTKIKISDRSVRPAKFLVSSRRGVLVPRSNCVVEDSQFKIFEQFYTFDDALYKNCLKYVLKLLAVCVSPKEGKARQDAQGNTFPWSCYQLVHSSFLEKKTTLLLLSHLIMPLHKKRDTLSPFV